MKTASPKSLRIALGNYAISLLSHNGKLHWRQTDAGPVVALPSEESCDNAVVLKIPDANLKPVPGAVSAGRE